MQVRLVYKFCCCFIILFFTSTASAKNPLVEQTCRIKGYAYELKCLHLPKQSYFDGEASFVLYRIQAKARYPLADPLVYIPGSLSKNPAGRALNLAQAYARMLTKRDFIWLGLDIDSDISKSCQPSNSNKISDFLEPLSNKVNVSNCIKDTDGKGNTYQELVLEAYTDKLLTALAQLNIKKINVITDGTGITKLKKIKKLQPTLLRQLVLFNPLDSNEDPIILKSNILQQSIADLDALCTKQNSCQVDKSTSSMLKALYQKLPRQYLVNNPVSNRQEQFVLTTDYFFKLIEFSLLSDTSMIALPNALKKTLDGNDIQSLLGISSYAWATDIKNSKINWDIALTEKCMSQPFKPSQNSVTLRGQYQQYLWRDFEKTCSGFKKPASLNKRSTSDDALNALTFNNQKNNSQLHRAQNYFYLPQFKGDLLTHGCTTDIVYKYINLFSLTDNDVFCLKNIPPLSPKIMAVRP